MTDRRFSDEEVAAIFKRATEVQQNGGRHLPQAEGMTLAEIQEIGREVGIAPELVAQVATTIDAIPTGTSERMLGLPVGVARTVNLGRKLTDEEWEHIVVDLRTTFNARGRVKSEGGFRQWTNGNLQALLEPTATGHRLRMKTVKGNARTYMTAGIATIGAVAVVCATIALRGGGMTAIAELLPTGLVGAGLFTLGAFQLPGWSRLRRQQMDEIAARVAERSALPASTTSG